MSAVTVDRWLPRLSRATLIRSDPSCSAITIRARLPMGGFVYCANRLGRNPITGLPGHEFASDLGRQRDRCIVLVGLGCAVATDARDSKL